MNSTALLLNSSRMPKLASQAPSPVQLLCTTTIIIKGARTSPIATMTLELVQIVNENECSNTIRGGGSSGMMLIGGSCMLISNEMTMKMKLIRSKVPLI